MVTQESTAILAAEESYLEDSDEFQLDELLDGLESADYV